MLHDAILDIGQSLLYQVIQYHFEKKLYKKPYVVHGSSVRYFFETTSTIKIYGRQYHFHINKITRQELVATNFRSILGGSWEKNYLLIIKLDWKVWKWMWWTRKFLHQIHKLFLKQKFWRWARILEPGKLWGQFSRCREKLGFAQVCVVNRRKTTNRE